jgi:hypothetical protein
MLLLGKPTLTVRSDAPGRRANRSPVLVVVALLVSAAPLWGQRRASIQVSAQVVAVQPSAEGLLAAQAMVRSENPAAGPVRGGASLATTRRTAPRPDRTRPAPVSDRKTASGALKPTSVIEIQFLRN